MPTTFTLGQELFSRFFAPLTQAYVIRSLGRVTSIQGEWLVVGGKRRHVNAWPTYASEEEGWEHVRARPFSVEPRE